MFPCREQDLRCWVSFLRSMCLLLCSSYSSSHPFRLFPLCSLSLVKPLRWGCLPVPIAPAIAIMSDPKIVISNAPGPMPLKFTHPGESRTQLSGLHSPMQVIFCADILIDAGLLLLHLLWRSCCCLLGLMVAAPPRKEPRHGGGMCAELSVVDTTFRVCFGVFRQLRRVAGAPPPCRGWANESVAKCAGFCSDWDRGEIGGRGPSGQQHSKAQRRGKEKEGMGAVQGRVVPGPGFLKYSSMQPNLSSSHARRTCID